MNREPEAIFITAAGQRHLVKMLAERDQRHLTPIIELLSKGVAITCVPQRWVMGKLRFPAPLKARPWVAIVGDDLFIAEGPEGFHLRTLRKLLEKAHTVYVMAGAAMPEFYQAAADIAEAGGNVIVVETQPGEEASWTNFVCRHAPQAARMLVTPNAAELNRRRNAA